jgi:hypothetical protein
VPDFTVKQYGTDSSGRDIWMTVYMHRWFDGICRELGFTPTVVQGAWMVRNGGGASESAGYHDGGGCLDLRVWDLTDTQVEAVLHATRWGGAGSWLRNAEHGGFDPHIHLVLGSDDGLSPGAAWQWLNYINNGDGLSGSGHDYHPRPRPLVTDPPDALMEDPMTPADFDKIREIVAAESRKAVDTLLDEEQANGKSLRENIRIGANARDVAREVLAAINDSAKKATRGSNR